jgi:glycosyltransferase involved in cell wall biosynthesis
MSSLERVLIISPDQFGYNDYFSYYSKYLSKNFLVDFWCLDKGNDKIEYPGNNIEYFKRASGKLQLTRFAFIIGLRLRDSNYKYILFRGFKLAFLSKILSGKKAIFDIRTVGVSGNFVNRLVYDILIRFNSLFFESIFTISSTITTHLKISPNKVSVIPLGAEINIERGSEGLKDLRFLYVGILDGRRIQDTIEGLVLFCSKYSAISITYTIVGKGSKTVIQEIDYAISKSPENLKVVRKGFIPSNDILEYYEGHNIGVSYVPMTRWYLLQPSTKTFEYLLAGMVVIATALPLNVEIINDKNGIVIYDNPESFCDGVENIYKRMKSYNLKEIGAFSKSYSWEKIIENKLTESFRNSAGNNLGN